MGLLQQVPAFDVSYAETEMLEFNTNTTIIRLQSQAFAYIKARRLILRGLSITLVDNLVFSGLEEIVINIDLGDNNISRLPYDTFFRLTRLTTIRVDGNQIAALDRSTFRGMSQLWHVDLANNLLQRLASTLFRDLINLQILQLHGNRMVTIPEGLLANLRNLEELDLSDNRLTTISSDAFASLANLKRLSLSGNMIAGTLTSSFLHQLGDLVVLNISRNSISALMSDAFHGCSQLLIIDISSNRLRSIQPNTFGALTSLKRLDLSANLIETLPHDLFAANSSVVEFDLAGNVLVDIGRFLLNVSRLRRLDLSQNLLSEIRLSAFTNLTNLVYLDVRNNRLDGQLGGRLFLQLEEFMIDGNNVTRIQLMGPSVRLARLSMSSNSLTTLPSLFYSPEMLLLDVSNNAISAVSDDSFSCCRSLRQLRLAGNRITRISDGAFRGLSVLSEIDLSANRLSYLSTGLFTSCVAMSLVNLSHNQLAAFDDGTFTGPMNLRGLDLSWNKLTSLTSNSILEVFFTLVRLSVAGNPLYCDCRLTWLSTYAALVNHNTTICCPQHDFQPAVCRYVVCESRSTCLSTNTTGSPTPPADYSPLCAQTVPSSVVAAVFRHHLTTPSPFTQTTDTSSVIAAMSLTTADSVTNSSRLTVCPAASSSFDNVDSYIIVVAVVLPVLAVGLTLAVVAVACMRRRSFVDWSDDEKKCPATLTLTVKPPAQLR